MTKIEQVVLGGGPAVAEAQNRLLLFLNNHDDQVFSLNDSDILDVRAWLTQPQADEPPPAFDELATFSIAAIRHSFKILRSQGKIATFEFGGRTYYGTSTAISSMRKKIKKPGRLKIGKTHQPGAGPCLEETHHRVPDE